MTPLLHSPSAILLPTLLLAVAHGFLQPKNCQRSMLMGTSCGPPQPQRTSPCFMSPPPSSDDDEDDDDSIDPNSLGDWRAFRMNLANTDLSSPSTSSTSIDGIGLEEEGVIQDSSSVAPAAETAPQKSRPKSVSKKNEELLNAQNAILAEEYLNGVWAHESAIPEVGGLVCRLPLEAEIYRGSPDSFMYKMLHSFLDSEEYGEEDSIPSTSLSASASTGGAAAASNSVDSMKGILERSFDDSAPSDDTEDDSTSFSALSANTVYWYRGAEKLLKNELVKLAANANSNGRIDADDLDETSLELLQLYMDHQETWQEVCLVTEKNERTGSAQTLTINRPMAFKLSKSMARLVLLGAYQVEQGQDVIKKESDGAQTQNLVKFLAAFENQCGVYVGGSDDMDKPAVMIHGVDGLPGAEEISPGTGIYKGGLEAAMDGVMSGKYSPLDFRFFIGHGSYVGGELDEAVALGKYQPVACSRPLVLKQCIQLPKPLWHEVLEFCGGELKEISKLELAKREDLQ